MLPSLSFYARRSGILFRGTACLSRKKSIGTNLPVSSAVDKDSLSPAVAREESSQQHHNGAVNQPGLDLKWLNQEFDVPLAPPPKEQKEFYSPDQGSLPKNLQENTLTESPWVQISPTPPYLILQDIIRNVGRVMEIERGLGIVDLEKKDGSTVDNDQTGQWVRSARIMLSSTAMPAGWMIRFANRSIAHAFLKHTEHLAHQKKYFHLAWGGTNVRGWVGDVPPKLDVNENWIRVENSDRRAQIEDMRHFFRQYDLTRHGPSVRKWPTLHKGGGPIFLVHFADAENARAAICQKQGHKIGAGNRLFLLQYPKQIV